MSIDTKKVQGHRAISYQSLGDLSVDATRCAEEGWVTIGNWSVGQIYHHLSVALHASMDGYGFKCFWPKRLIARTFFKKKFLTQGLPRGTRIPGKMKRLEPTDMPVHDALTQLASAIERYQANPKRAPHPILGKLTNEESDQFMLRHAELHMGFIVPARQ
ncbi:MAG: DUF1569 domain-containing protein [Planctomycetota bacterium]|nr:DUF1569 domain-containing protein [Planctomycetota bacterium]